MEARLVELGFGIVHPALILCVERENERFGSRAGEPEKARAWGRELAIELLG